MVNKHARLSLIKTRAWFFGVKCTQWRCRVVDNPILSVLLEVCGLVTLGAMSWIKTRRYGYPIKGWSFILNWAIYHNYTYIIIHKAIISALQFWKLYQSMMNRLKSEGVIIAVFWQYWMMLEVSLPNDNFSYH